MKNLRLLIPACILLIFQSCGNKNENFEAARPAHIASYELVGDPPTDTINLTDNNGLKQGKWLLAKPLDGSNYGSSYVIDTIIFKDGVKVKKPE